MPIAIPVNQLEPGMLLATNVVNRFSVLLPRGRVLTEGDVAALVKRFPRKMVQVHDPLLDGMTEFQDCQHDLNVSVEVRRNVAQVAHKVSGTVRTGAALTADNISGMQRTIDEMINHLSHNPVTVALIEQGADWDDYLQEHTANVFYLSLVVGNTIRNYIKRERERLSAAKHIHDAMRLTPLATAALIHDIGMAPLQQLYHKQAPLTDDELAAVRRHPADGAALLPDKVHPMVPLVVRCHHESQNGAGYPAGLPGDQVPIFARIIRVADAYAAAVSDRAYQQAKSPARVLYEMTVGVYRGFYDPTVMRVFAAVTQPFPVGARLHLEDGRIAVVTRHNPRQPFRPEVIVALNAAGEPLPQNQVEGPFTLDERPELRLARFEAEDISFLNDLTPPCEPDDDPDTLERADLFQLAYP